MESMKIIDIETFFAFCNDVVVVEMTSEIPAFIHYVTAA